MDEGLESVGLHWHLAQQGAGTSTVDLLTFGWAGTGRDTLCQVNPQASCYELGTVWLY